ncbi:MAG TPA: hypothetical protein VF911_09240 [Thermoanaerobaculia bacterium]|jgi:hypothetical protein
MATKKSKAAIANDALLAVSTAASPEDHKNEIILQCIVSTFDAQGLNHISGPEARIVWSTIDDAVITLIGNGVRDCINSKGFDSVGLAGPFQNLKNSNQVTVVSDLVKGIAGLVTP